MLDRNTQTSSDIQNRLDLGARLFASASTPNMACGTLRIRPVHPEAVAKTVRAGIRPAVKLPQKPGSLMAHLPGSTYPPQTLGSEFWFARPVSQPARVSPWWSVPDVTTRRDSQTGQALRATAVGTPGALALG